MNKLRASDICYEGHENQMYGERPYLYHIFQVLAAFGHLFGKYSDDEEIVILLHDVVEDTDWTIEDLEKERFSAGILAAVDAITKRDDETRAEYIQRVKQNHIAKRVKIADTYANLTASLKEGHVRRINKYTKQLADLYREE
jgi:(p)ppGpp synthase/HD superfamily hydrolase